MDPMSLPDLAHTTAGAADAAGCHGPYQHQPTEDFLAPAQRTTMLHAALDGVALGTWDQRILAWLCHWADTPTFLAILGWIERARQAADRRLADLAGEYELTKGHFSDYAADTILTRHRLEQERDQARQVARRLLRHLQQCTAPPSGLPTWISDDDAAAELPAGA
jgi:hypothetical protein